ncbi:M protein trans-acting positive regulator [Enterococcus faecalis 02-MB-P-10]|uniref:helix-turn-helix domain-containing protein n=1 Tax=Enterococcus faecalis TaxID=1351 RepID=UPI0003534BB2|nr:helix-turn-helix domain-containing protein [Enterococcus faecalis]EPH77375.1 M protein trans-acting positive regulator [Enterococcus faecalis 02-MB-P-10]
MNLNYFLEIDNRKKYEIISHLEEYKSTYVNTSMIREINSISKFKLNQYINELNDEIQDIDELSSIVIQEDDEIRVYNIDAFLVKKLRLIYLERSPIYNLFVEIVNGKLSPTEYANKYFVSRSIAYSYKKQLVPILSEANLSYERNELIGNEQDIRNLIFSIYFEFFNGIKSPFNEEEDRKISGMLDNISAYFQLNLTTTRKLQLTFYLGIVMKRISRDCYIPTLSSPFFCISNSLEFMGLSKLITDPSGYLNSEGQYLFLFLYCQDILSVREKKVKLLVKNDTQYLIDIFFNSLEVEVGMKNKFNKEAIDLFEQQILKINIKNKFFYTSIETFSSVHSFLFFIESYPSVIIPLKETVDSYARKEKIDDVMLKTRIYYDYLFAFLSVVPANTLEKKIYICVDFSHGPNYTKFIAEQISEFKSLNVEIQYRVTARTHLFISDFSLSNVMCEQIIWKNPPTADDWEDFGNTIVKIKQERLNK